MWTWRFLQLTATLMFNTEWGSTGIFVLYINWSCLQARRIIREWNGRVSDPLKARANFFEMIKAAGCLHESSGDYRSFQEHHRLADSFGTVLNKVFIISCDWSF